MNKEALHALEANGFQRATSDGGILVKLPSAHSASSIVRIEPLTGPTEMENSSSSSAVAAAAFAFDALPLVKDKSKFTHSVNLKDISLTLVVSK